MEVIIILGIIAFLIFLSFFIFGKSVSLIFKLALNTVIGVAALILINMVGINFGITIGVNLINGLVVGVLGVPGVALLLLLQWLMII